MSIFNLKRVAKDKNKDLHTDKMLSDKNKKNPKDAGPDEINQKQLSDYRTDEKDANESIQKRLEKVRVGDVDRITERRLETESGDFDIKFRNKEAFTGNINKLEEKRLANKPVEKEKYDSASSTPEKFKWWKDTKSPDGLKIARTAADDTGEDFENLDFDVVESLTDPSEYAAPQDGKKTTDTIKDELSQLGVSLDKQEQSEEELTEENADFLPDEKQERQPIEIVKAKFITDGIPGAYIVAHYDVTDYGSEDDIKEEALKTIVGKYPFLSDLISIDDLYVREEDMKGIVTLRAAGDKFEALSSVENIGSYDMTSAGDVGMSKNKPESVSFSETINEEPADNFGYDYIEEVSYEEQDVDGTPMAIGEVSLKIDEEDFDPEDVVADVISYINEKHPNLSLTEESVDISKLRRGKINYVAPLNVDVNEDVFVADDTVANVENVAGERDSVAPTGSEEIFEPETADFEIFDKKSSSAWVIKTSAEDSKKKAKIK